MPCKRLSLRRSLKASLQLAMVRLLKGMQVLLLDMDKTGMDQQLVLQQDMVKEHRHSQDMVLQLIHTHGMVLQPMLPQDMELWSVCLKVTLMVPQVMLQMVYNQLLSRQNQMKLIKLISSLEMVVFLKKLLFMVVLLYEYCTVFQGFQKIWTLHFYKRIVTLIQNNTLALQQMNLKHQGSRQIQQKR